MNDTEDDIVARLDCSYSTHPIVMEAAREIDWLRKELEDARDLIERLITRHGASVHAALLED